MGRKAKFSKEVKLKAIREYQKGNKSITQITYELGCYDSTIRKWINLYSCMGEIAFEDKQRNKAYSKELKMSAINDYLIGLGSLEDISIKYRIYSKETLRSCIIY